MKIITFKKVDQAIDYVCTTEIKVNEFYFIVRELEEKGTAKVNEEYLFIDPFDLLESQGSNKRQNKPR